MIAPSSSDKLREWFKENANWGEYLDSKSFPSYHRLSVKDFAALQSIVEEMCGETKDRGVLLGQAMAYESWMWPASILENGHSECLVNDQPIPKKYARNITKEARDIRDKKLAELGEITPEERDWRLAHKAQLHAEQQPKGEL